MNDKEFENFVRLVFGPNVLCATENEIKFKPATPPCTHPTNEKPKFEIVSLLANKDKGAFTVVWGDGTHTVIHIQDGDNWDDEKALAMCFVKKLMGNKGNFNDIFTEVMPAKLKTIEKKEEPKKALPIVEAVAPAAESAAKSMSTAANSMSEMVKKMVNKPVYTIYDFAIISGDKKPVCTTTDKVDVQAFVSNWQKKKNCEGYTRCWNSDEGLVIDFGSHARYLIVEGMTMDEYLGK